MCVKLNAKFRSVFTLEDTSQPTLTRWDNMRTWRAFTSIDTSGIMQSQDLYKMFGLILNECAETLNRLLETFGISTEEEMMPKEWKRAKVLPNSRKGIR